jgi:hypothetical protein
MDIVLYGVGGIVVWLFCGVLTIRLSNLYAKRYNCTHWEVDRSDDAYILLMYGPIGLMVIGCIWLFCAVKWGFQKLFVMAGI